MTPTSLLEVSPPGPPSTPPYRMSTATSSRVEVRRCPAHVCVVFSVQAFCSGQRAGVGSEAGECQTHLMGTLLLSDATEGEVDQCLWENGDNFGLRVPAGFINTRCLYILCYKITVLAIKLRKEEVST